MVCYICNKYEKENLVPILNVCPIYNALRDFIENVENFWDILRPLNLQKLRSLYNFIEGGRSTSPFIYYKRMRGEGCFFFSWFKGSILS